MKNIHHDSSHERFSESFMTSTLKICFENRNLLYRNQTQLDPVSAFLIFRLQMSIGGNKVKKVNANLNGAHLYLLYSQTPYMQYSETPQMQHSGTPTMKHPRCNTVKHPRCNTVKRPRCVTEKHPRYNTVKLKRRSLVSCNKVKTPDAVQ